MIEAPSDAREVENILDRKGDFTDMDFRDKKEFSSATMKNRDKQLWWTYFQKKQNSKKLIFAAKAYMLAHEDQKKQFDEIMKGVHTTTNEGTS